MKEFDKLVETFEVLDSTVIAEHCKTGQFFKPYNILQSKILRHFYDNYMRKLENHDYGDLNNTQLFLLFYDKFNFILEFLGNKLCKDIPNEKTLEYSSHDIENWSKELLDLIIKK